MSTEDEARSDLEAIRECLRRDRAEGRVRSLSDYLARFPHDERSVAREYLALESELDERENGAEIGQRLGPYAIGRELGRGGQAVVYLAEDTRLGRRVALKVLPAVVAGTDTALARLRREAQLTSRLEHPGICALYDLGIERGVAYLAMRFIEGETLARRIASAAAANEMPDAARISELVHYFERAAGALHVAHEAGVIHRDIKPGNLMVSPEGAPVVLDFGLAQQDEANQALLSASGGLSGTPAYMSPEQLRGAVRLDRRTDVYSLAASLYEALTLAHPFAAATREEIFHTILNVDPPDPRKKNPAIPPDLAIVLATALEKQRDRRYDSAGSFAEDLRRVREHEPIRARKVGRGERALRWARRNPALAASAFGLAALALTASGLLSYGLGASDKAALELRLRELATADRDAAERERALLEQTAADRRFVERVDELSLELGTMVYGLRGQVDLRPLARRIRESIEAHGIPLGAGSSTAALAASAVLAERDAAAGDSLLGALRSLSDLVSRARSQPPPMDAIDPELATAAARAEEICKLREGDVVREIRRTAELWSKEKRDEFDPLLADEFLARCTPEEIGELMSMAIDVEGRAPDVLDAFERAIRQRPESFALRYSRGGIGLSLASDSTDRAASLEAAEAALRHMEVAVALRPRSGIARSLLASLQAITARYPEAMQSIETSVQLQPDSGLVWLMKGWFYSYTPMREKAMEALNRALELDATLDKARELLRDLEQRRAGGTAPGR